ncbi:helix-turn-helix domain-containing protein [Streptomyces sp. NPDC087297]|uniref:helix-turn-helix domain-containing protein n=1 Tax=Streptomyces sp. NPDC087297 TaxID=3365778 RepID=UPI003811F748
MDRRKQITGAARETLAAQLKTDYESGSSIRTLANGIGRSYGFVHRILIEADVNLRRRGGAERVGPPRDEPVSAARTFAL